MQRRYHGKQLIQHKDRGRLWLWASNRLSIDVSLRLEKHCEIASCSKWFYLENNEKRTALCFFSSCRYLWVLLTTDLSLPGNGRHQPLTSSLFHIDPLHVHQNQFFYSGSRDNLYGFAQCRWVKKVETLHEFFFAVQTICTWWEVCAWPWVVSLGTAVFSALSFPLQMRSRRWPIPKFRNV